MAIEPIKGFYVHDEVTDTDGVATVSATAVDGLIAGFENTTGSYPLYWQKNKSLTISGATADVNNPASEAHWECCVEPCTAGDVFSVKGYGGSGTRLWGFADSNGNMLSISESALHTFTFVLAVAPENAAYFIANSRYDSIKGYAYKGNIYSTYAYRFIQFYPTAGRTILFEEDSTSKIVYVHFEHALHVRYGENGSRFQNDLLFKTFTVGAAPDTPQYVTISDSTGIELITSPNGLTNCLPIQDDYSLVFDMSDTRLKVVDRYAITKTQIVLVANDTGYIVDLHPALQKFYTSKLIEDSKETEENPIPSYWDSAITEAENSINEYLSAGENTAAFGFVTDTHIESNQGYSGHLLEKVLNDCYIPLWLHGGDVATGAVSAGDATAHKTGLIGLLLLEAKQFAAVENRCLRTIGNHEQAYTVSSFYDHNLTDGEINHYYWGVDRNKDVQVCGERKGYHYRDVPKDKMRFIVLDMNAYNSQIDANELVTGFNKHHDHIFGSVQLEWLIKVLSNVPEDYGVVICSHMVPVTQAELRSEFSSAWTDTYPIDYAVARGICNAYINKSTYSYDGSISGDLTGETYAIDADFSDANGDLVCWIGGHSHRDFVIKKDDIQFITTANDSISVSTSVPSHTPQKTEGTDTEQILDFFCVDKDEKTINVVRLGAYVENNGKVRTVNYE